MPNFSVVFLGGVFFDEDAILEDSVGPVQNAANSLQKKYISGFVDQEDVISVDIVNFPFIFPYPKFYKKKTYKPTRESGVFLGANIHERSFLNLRFFRFFSRAIGAFFCAFTILKKRKNNEIIFICYSMHFPFVLACFLLKIFCKKPIFGLIIPDLPEFMAVRSGIKKIIYNLFSKISYWLARRQDFVVLITQQMRDFFPKQPSFIIEGMSDFCRLDVDLASSCFNLPDNFFFYSGTLDKRYGILDLLAAFASDESGCSSLVVCGSGNASEDVLSASMKNKRIVFLGQIPNKDVILIQKKANFLINPRKNSLEYTKYSFPSKIMEYMSSGTPVLMYKLDGVPSEYYDHCYTVDDFNRDLMCAIRNLSIMNNNETVKKGLGAKKFVFKNKNPRSQIFSLIDFIKEKFYVQK